jgi:hypothetical protein
MRAVRGRSSQDRRYFSFVGNAAVIAARLLAFALVFCAATPAAASDGTPDAGLVDVGLRIAFARPIGAFVAGTHATDVSFGGTPLGLDATSRLTTSSPSSWSVAAGAYAAYAPTIPTLCTDTSWCISSIGHDTELDLLARVRAPRLAFVVPEVEIAAGWS